MTPQIPLATKGAARKRILIVEDHPLMREGLRGAINRDPNMMVCGEAENAKQAMEVVEKSSPDLVLLDITLPGKSGLELLKDIKAKHPQLRMLAISMHDESLYAERALHAGASGYINKERPPEELLKAIRQVLSDHIYVSNDVSENIVNRHIGWPVTASPLSGLTDREFEIFQMYGVGLSPKEIAKQLCLSVKTVAAHNANIRLKLKLKSTAHLVRLAVQLEDSKAVVRPSAAAVLPPASPANSRR